MNTPFLIFIDGPMGSGKTTTTKLLNQKLPDTARVAMPDIKRLVPNYKENPDTLVIIRDVMANMVDTYLKHNVGVIVEQVTSASGIETLRKIAEKHNAKFYAFRLGAPKDHRLTRVHARTKKDIGVEELEQTKIDELTSYFEPNHQFYLDNPADTSEFIDTEKMGPEEVVDFIINKLFVKQI